MARTKGDKPPLTPKERAEKSAAARIAAGGRRFNLWLTKEANNALSEAMKSGNYADETTAINEALIQLENNLNKR